MNPLIIIELVLKIVLEAMEGQPPEVKKQLWEWHVKDLAAWRKFLKLDADDTVTHAGN